MARKFKRERHLTVVGGTEAPAPAPSSPPAPACPACAGPLEGARCAACRLWVGRAPYRWCRTMHGQPTVDPDGGCWRCTDAPLVALRHERRGAVGVWVETDREAARVPVEVVAQLLDATFGPGWRAAADLTDRVGRRLRAETPAREPGED